MSSTQGGKYVLNMILHVMAVLHANFSVVETQFRFACNSAQVYLIEMAI